MRLYADTSWWLAYKSRADRHHEAAISLFDLCPKAEVLWTPWQRIEVFNCFRQLERAGLLGDGEAQVLVGRLNKEVQLGYWRHAEFSWTDAVRTGCEISEKVSLRIAVRAMDLFHVAVALEVAADALLTFDEDQARLARSTGLKTLKLRERKRHRAS